MNRNSIWQVSRMNALLAGELDGIVPAAEVKAHGDVGLGTFDSVNGELILLDGTVYQVLGDGTVIEAPDDETVPFAVAGFVDDDAAPISIEAADLADFEAQLDVLGAACGGGQFYLVKLACACSSLTVHSVSKQEKPYGSVAEALASKEGTFEFRNIAGTMVGVCCPESAAELNTPGWHLHFLSEDRAAGGHVLALENLSGTCTISAFSSLDVVESD